MTNTVDVCSIGLPALRLFQQAVPEAELHFLTFGDAGKLIQLAEPSVTVHCMTTQQWSDDFFLALESFLGLAAQIIGEEYSQIVNLDTAFMPCFLSRFLKDALEPITGNFLNVSVQELLDQVQKQSLQAQYVNDPQAYLDSTFTNMYKWHGSAWHYGEVPDGGYPEYYLSQCCGFDTSAMQSSIPVTPDKSLSQKAKKTKVIALCLGHSDDGYAYPFAEPLKKALQQKGYQVWSETQAKGQLQSLLKMLSASDLMISKPTENRWYAQAVDCPVLLISGDSLPAILMPDFATDPTNRCQQHGQQQQQPAISAMQACSCDLPEDLLESVESIFEHLAQEPAGE
jgi:ADP-heptose:LPS heptosyltransferase